jgi:hypothetical protein
VGGKYAETGQLENSGGQKTVWDILAILQRLNIEYLRYSFGF